MPHRHRWILGSALMLLLARGTWAQDEATETEATETEATETEATETEATETEATETEATETEADAPDSEATDDAEGQDVEIDCDGADLAEFTARVNAAAERRGVEPPTEEQIAQMFERADQNGDGHIGPAEGRRLADRAPHPGRARAHMWRHRVRCAESAD